MTKNMFITVQRVAQILGVTTQHVYNLIQSGKLDTINISVSGNPKTAKSVRVSQNSLDEFILNRKIDHFSYYE